MDVMPEPKITVIINSYNYEKYIGQAIDSVLSQDYANKEIIVVDDGSTDGSKDIILAYGESIKAIFHENLGQARTCLRALRQASGDFIQFLDSDDYLLPGAISAVAAVALPDVAKIQFQLLPVGPDGAVVGEPWPAMSALSRQDLIKSIERRGSYVTPPNSGNVYRSDVFGYIDDIDYEGSIDGIPYLLAPLLGEVRQIARPLACYRYHTENFSGHGKLDPARFALEARRHKRRLDHLSAISRQNNLPEISISDPDGQLFVTTRDILRKISEGGRPGVPLVARYSLSLFREKEGMSRTVKLLIWGVATQILPDKSRRRLAIYRSDPRSRGPAKGRTAA